MDAIHALCSPSVQIMLEIRLLFYVLEARQVLLLPEYIPTLDTVILDALPRATNYEDYRLAARLFHLIETRFDQ